MIQMGHVTLSATSCDLPCDKGGDIMPKIWDRL